LSALDISASNEPAASAEISRGNASPMEQPRRHGRIDDIELLRALAIIFVLFEHSRFILYPWLGINETRFHGFFGFWTGVDLFFAISGFVIARSLLPTLASARNSMEFFNAALAFWIRRVWRLVPSAWLWLVIPVIASAVFNESGIFESFRANFEGAVAAILDVANFRIVLVFERFESGATFPYWSLSLEEQFYFLLPIVIFWSGHHLPRVLGIAILLQIFSYRMGAHLSVLGMYLNQLRSDGLLLGVLIAIWSSQPAYKVFDPIFLNKNPWIGSVTFAFLLTLLAVAGSTRLHIVPFQLGLVALVSAVLVFVASYDKSCFCPDGPLKNILLWFGSRSYGLYLIHIPVYFATREIWYRLQPPGTIFTDRFAVRFTYTAAILLFGLAELNYRFVELPLRLRGTQIAKDIASRRDVPSAREAVDL
jgi:peptidoglycan/LPS O-acetylase OafA/YrhL